MCCRAIVLSLLCSFFLACVCVSLLPRDQQHVSILRFNEFLSSKLHVQVWHVAGEYCGAELLNDFQAAGNDLEQLQQNLIAIHHLSTLDLLAPSLPAIKKKLTPNMLPDEPVRFLHSVQPTRLRMFPVKPGLHSLCSPRGHRCSRASIGSRGPLARPSVIHRRQSKGPLASCPLIIFFNQTRIQQLEVQSFRVLFFKMCDIEKNFWV